MQIEVLYLSPQIGINVLLKINKKIKNLNLKNLEQEKNINALKLELKNHEKKFYEMFQDQEKKYNEKEKKFHNEIADLKQLILGIKDNKDGEIKKKNQEIILKNNKINQQNQENTKLKTQIKNQKKELNDLKFEMEVNSKNNAAKIITLNFIFVYPTLIMSTLIIFLY